MLINSIKRKYLLIVFAMGLTLTAHSEGNLPYVDDKLIHFGFSLGVNFMDFGIVSNPDLVNTNARVSILSPGFSVGMITDLRLNRYLNLRFTPTLHFGDRQINYYPRSKNDSVTISSIPICLPFYLKYSAERKGNYRPYVIWGGGVSIDLGTNKENPVLLKPLNFYTEFGVGCDLYFSFFKLAPELKYSIGFNNIFTPLDKRESGQLTTSQKQFSLLLSKLTSRMLTLTFNFE